MRVLVSTIIGLGQSVKRHYDIYFIVNISNSYSCLIFDLWRVWFLFCRLFDASGKLCFITIAFPVYLYL